MYAKSVPGVRIPLTPQSKTLKARYNKVNASAFYLYLIAADGYKKKPKLAEIFLKIAIENDACRKLHANCTQMICVQIVKSQKVEVSRGGRLSHGNIKIYS